MGDVARIQKKNTVWMTVHQSLKPGNKLVAVYNLLHLLVDDEGVQRLHLRFY